MRIAKHGALEQRRMLGQLRARVKAPAGVVEVHVAVAIEASEFGPAKLVELPVVAVARVLAPERRFELEVRRAEVDVDDAHRSRSAG